MALDALQTGRPKARDRCPACNVERGDSERCGHCGAAFAAGGYVVVEQIAQSARGRIYLAEDTEGHRVALKELVFTQVPDHSALEAFRREAEILRTLSHPGIPRFLGSFQEGSGVGTRLYLAQEFVEGVSLEARLSDHRFTEEEALSIGRRVLAILTYLQRLSPKVFHRDVKPANLVARPDGSIALVDFGAARGTPGTLGATLDVGTYGYMPPEQLVGDVDSSSDVYALGVTLLRLLTRLPPRELVGANAGKSLRHANVSPRTARWLQRLVAVEPIGRFPDATEARRALDESGDVGTVRQAPIGRRAVLVAIGAVLIAAGVIAAAALATRTVSSPPPVLPAVHSASGMVQPLTGGMVLQTVPGSFYYAGDESHRQAIDIPVFQGEGGTAYRLLSYTKAWRDDHRATVEFTRPGTDSDPGPELAGGALFIEANNDDRSIARQVWLQIDGAGGYLPQVLLPGEDIVIHLDDLRSVRFDTKTAGTPAQADLLALLDKPGKHTLEAWVSTYGQYQGGDGSKVTVDLVVQWANGTTR